MNLRLVDPDGYTVPGTVHTDVPDTNEPKVRAILQDAAVADAAQWADFGHQPAAYRIVTDPTTQTRTEAIHAAAIAVRAYQNNPTTELFGAMTTAIDAAQALGATETDLITAALNR